MPRLQRPDDTQGSVPHLDPDHRLPRHPGQLLPSLGRLYPGPEKRFKEPGPGQHCHSDGSQAWTCSERDFLANVATNSILGAQCKIYCVSFIFLSSQINANYSRWEKSSSFNLSWPEMFSNVSKIDRLLVKDYINVMGFQFKCNGIWMSLVSPVFHTEVTVNV